MREIVEKGDLSITTFNYIYSIESTLTNVVLECFAKIY